MTQNTIQFDLVSPAEKLVSEPVAMAVIPGTEGELGVGAGHASFVVALKPGVVKLYKEQSAEPRRIFIAGGFADITGESCTVLAEEAVNVNDLNAPALEKEISKLTADLNAAVEEMDKIRLQRKLTLAQARLEALAGK
ncbi:MAG: ATP synthase F1 subunit epsilon [Alphaproteobacteria bacterium]|nr:ATP synthase F1 subunit epsilon [Alphaproteobacteria bacterium]